MLSYGKYPRNWKKASRTIRRITGYLCEQCGKPAHSVHHKGMPFATGDGWRPGKRSDKHDLRRENLASLCYDCHNDADGGALDWYSHLRKRGASKKRKHRALGIGTGLVPLKPVRLTAFHWLAFASLHYALLRWSKRTGRSRYQLTTTVLPAPVIVDSYIVRELV